MNRKSGYISLLGLSILGFVLIVLQYKVTELSLEIPHLQESYLAKKQNIEKLELDLRMLKNPKHLLECKEMLASKHFVFPNSQKTIAVTYHSCKSDKKVDEVKSATMNLPLAKVFP